MTKFIFPVIFLCAISLFSCHHFGGEHVRGTGNVKRVSRSAGDFTYVDVSSAIELHVKQDSTRSVNIETDENLLEFIIVESDGDRLRIFTERGFNLDPSNGDKVEVYVSSPVFKRLEASGACTVIGDNMLTSDGQLDIDLSGASDASLDLKMPAVTVGMSGASNVSLKGETKNFSIEGSGASHARCFDLLSENTDADVSGASSAEVYASVKIDASASGASSVKYKGKAAIGTKSESGASSIERME